MTQPDLSQRLDNLIATWENEVEEFKQAGNDYSTDDIGKYFSALANEANLRGTDGGWLVFGVSNKTRSVVGTDYRPQSERLHSLKMQIAENAEPRITFREIHELAHADGRVLIFEIPAAPQGIPIAWKGHYYARAGESLTSLGLDKLDDIRRQTLAQDWTAQVVPGATLDDLDDAAVQKARESFTQKYANRFQPSEVEGWSLATFLDRARVTQHGQITRAALLLLGKAESSFRLSPYPAQLTWKLEGQERAYEHFGPPFLLVFENEGSFFEGQPDEYIQGDKTPRRYRNPALAQAMVELNMIDTMGYGIHSIYTGQARRYFPLPDYDLSEPGAVKLTIYGGVVDPAYSRLLIQNTDLPLADVLALDRVQKKLPIPDEAAARLRRSKLIEGRKPNFHVSASVAEATANKADYIRTRAQDDEFYAKLLTDYLEKFGQANRAEINKLLMVKLSDALDDKQKYNKISSLLTRLRRHGVIVNTGSDTAPCWRLTESIAKRN